MYTVQQPDLPKNIRKIKKEKKRKKNYLKHLTLINSLFVNL